MKDHSSLNVKKVDDVVGMRIIQQLHRNRLWSPVAEICTIRSIGQPSGPPHKWLVPKCRPGTSICSAAECDSPGQLLAGQPDDAG